MAGLLLRLKWTDLRVRETMCGDSWSHHVMSPWQTSWIWKWWLAGCHFQVTPDWTVVNTTATPLCGEANL